MGIRKPFRGSVKIRLVGGITSRKRSASVIFRTTSFLRYWWVRPAGYGRMELVHEKLSSRLGEIALFLAPSGTTPILPPTLEPGYSFFSIGVKGTAFGITYFSGGHHRHFNRMTTRGCWAILPSRFSIEWNVNEHMLERVPFTTTMRGKGTASNVKR